MNGIFLKELNKWIRLDARGNKPGVQAEFSIDREILAWPVNPEIGEIDDPVIYAQPDQNVIHALKNSKNRKEIGINWLNIGRSINL